MRQAGFVIIVAVLTLSACGKKSEEESAAVKSPMSSVEQKPAVVAEQPVQAPAEAMTPDASMPAPAVAPAPAPAEAPAKMKEPTPPTEKEKAPDGMSGQALSHDEGLALAGKSGCLACHKIEAKLVGPAWRDVSKRYKGDPDAKARLVAKVKTGGKGNWTEVTGGVSMPPYSPRVSDENIEKLVTFVLSQ